MNKTLRDMPYIRLIAEAYAADTGCTVQQALTHCDAVSYLELLDMYQKYRIYENAVF